MLERSGLTPIDVFIRQYDEDASFVLLPATIFKSLTS